MDRYSQNSYFIQDELGSKFTYRDIAEEEIPYPNASNHAFLPQRNTFSVLGQEKL
jgi:hypothetical protein